MAAWMATRSVSVTPTPPRPTARPGGDRSESTGAAPARRMRDTSRAGPTASRSWMAGTLSESCKRAADAHRAVELAVEIGGRVAGEVDRPVLDQALGMHETLLEGEAVDQRLQRRARRADGARHVDEAAAALVEEAGRADRGENLAGLVVGDEDGDRNGIGERGGALRGERFQAALQAGLDGEPVDGSCPAPRRPGARRYGRRASGHGAAGRRHLFRPRRGGVVLGQDAGRDDAREHAVAGGFGACGVAVGAAPLRRLRQGDEQRRLGRVQPARLLAEIGERGGAHALDVAAIGGERQVELEDLVLGERPLQSERGQHLVELAGGAAGRIALRAAARPAWSASRRRRRAARGGRAGRRRGRAPERRRRDACGNAGPHRRAASSRRAGRRRRASPAGASVRRRWRRDARARRCGRAPACRSPARAAAAPPAPPPPSERAAPPAREAGHDERRGCDAAEAEERKLLITRPHGLVELRPSPLGATG